MTAWQQDIEAASAAFLEVSALSGIQLCSGDLEFEFLTAPHRSPTNLPSGKMAIYAFWGDGGWLKVGMAGQKSKARYTSQHYNAGSAPSTLAASLVRWSSTNTLSGFDAIKPGDWLRSNCHRANILMSAEQPRELLALLEAFLHVRLRPRHER